ncbi:MAG: hypothetical protein DWQ04_08235 [Chloroflexi bacterium]|nr:MAG: hypothetical protein DWQ04_08235 [Chloroflexota bacterium]
MNLLRKLKPATNKLWLYAVAGLMWSGVGIFLNKLAYGWLAPLKWLTIVPFVLAGIGLAITIYAFGFSKLAKKNINRIVQINNEKVCIFAFQQWSSYPLVAFMISLGIFLRKYSPIPKPYLAIMYIGIGGSLFLASTHYYQQIIQSQRGIKIGHSFSQINAD